MKIVLVTGGARSGKSTFAETYIESISNKIGYVATAEPFDEGMKDRIKKHIEQRPGDWPTFECYEEVSPCIEEIAKGCDVVLLDCITVMVTNLMFKNCPDWTMIQREEINEIEKKITKEIEMLIQHLIANNLSAVLVTNEVGAGIVPENRLARLFRDIAGRVNQQLAKQANEVYFVVSGIPMQIK